MEPTKEPKTKPEAPAKEPSTKELFEAVKVMAVNQKAFNQRIEQLETKLAQLEKVVSHLAVVSGNKAILKDTAIKPWEFDPVAEMQNKRKGITSYG